MPTNYKPTAKLRRRHTWPTAAAYNFQDSLEKEEAMSNLRRASKKPLPNSDFQTLKVKNIT
eukprot:CAMPEP_0194308278 /NCGR_PEP_ID=MMETSP0171-20130528/5249_1 /TAXON_ID=218684 /ORGANISM="Corethron pennatum, Strain L29A3" /LENGTH=60 /DNA_ID=CAMNT_0039060827 /DNA_START=27 /DNA_END=206 /DNA_ORIENTATION=-